MPILTFEKHGKSRIIAQVTHNGELLGRVESKFSDSTNFGKVAAELQISKEDFRKYLNLFEKGEGDSFDLSRPFELRVRDIRGTESEAVRGEDAAGCLLTACQKQWPFNEPIAVWEDRTVLAAVDLDATGWTDRKLAELLDTFHPRPTLSWVTRSGGLRLVYSAAGNLTAEEAASVAYLHLYTTESFTSLEIKSDTRLPQSHVHETEQTANYYLLKKWLKDYTVDDEDVKKWLQSTGLESGKRYTHDRCPVAPSSTAKGDPIEVRDNGIKCYVCEAHGVERGGNKSGWFPFSVFVGTSASTAVHSCINGFCHWEHARHVIEDKIGMSGHAARLAYSTMIKLHHPTVKTTAKVFDHGKDLLRIEGAWTNSNGEPYTKSIRDVLLTLPAVNGLNGKATPSKVAVLEQSFDLSSYGYPSLTPVFGMKMAKFSNSRDVQVVVQTPNLAIEDKAQYRPRYVLDRAKDPWQLIEDACPGISKAYVKLLLVARGFSEAQVGMPPMVFVSGPTSSAKTGTIKVAAAIAGDSVSEHVWTDNIDRIRQAIRDSKSTGSYVVFNEFFKEAERLRQTAVQAADFVLNLTPDSMSWKIWVGPVRLGALPVFVWTDTHVPSELKADAQLSRRLMHVHLHGQVDWRDSLLRTIGQVNNLRTYSKDHAWACNSIVSEVMDEYFDNIGTFEAAAKKLGYETMAESQEAAEAKNVLAVFFQAVCDASPPTGADATRWSGRGWKVIVRGQETPLSVAWDSVRDENWVSSRKCSEVDWVKVVKATQPLVFELRAHGQSKLAVRFKSVAGTRSTYDVNEELFLTK